MDGLTIRPARDGDVADVARLIDQLGYHAAPDDVGRRLANLSTTGKLVLVAQLSGQVVGCCSTSTMIVLHRPKPVGRISMLVVDESVRGNSIGRKLVAAAEKHLHDEGCGIMEVTSHSSRTRAHGFYEELGYSKTSVRLARDL